MDGTAAQLGFGLDERDSRRRCIVCARTDREVRFATAETNRCTDCARAHGAAVSAERAATRARPGFRQSPARRRAARDAKRHRADLELQVRAAARAAARGETYQVTAQLTRHERLRLQSEEETIRRLDREQRRAKRATTAGERAEQVAQRKSERTPLAKVARAVLHVLATANTLDEEVLALVAGLDGRASDWVLRRWGFREWPAPTLEALGAEGGVSRERARQIVAARESHLRQLHDQAEALTPLRLRVAEHAVAALTARGGMLSSAEFTSALEKDGVSASPSARRALLALAEAGLVTSIAWDSASDLWLDAANQAVLRDGSLARARQHFLTTGVRSVQRTGALSLTRILQAAPLPYDHAIALLFGDTPVTRVSGYLVPQTQRDSRLARRARDMAAVSPGITVEDIRRGLRRLMPKPLRLPAPVIRAVLEGHPDFRLVGGAVYLVAPLPLEEILYPGDITLVRALRARAGVITFPDAKAVFAEAGISPGYFLRAAHSPWLIGIHGGFALRGHPAVSAIAETNERLQPGLPRSRVFVKLLWADADTARIRYRVIPASLRGVLRLPNRIVARLEETKDPQDAAAWTVTTNPPLVAGPGPSLGADGASFTGLGPYLTSVAARSGQHIELLVHFDVGRIDLRMVDEATATADEARWAAEQEERWRHRSEATPRAGATSDGAPRDPQRRRRRRRVPTVTVREFGDYFEVPNHRTDLRDVTFHRLRGTPAPESDLLVAALSDFQLAPGTTGVTMCLIFPLTATQGKRRIFSDLLETRMLDDALPVTWDEATQLVRHLEEHLVRGRQRLSWREYQGGLRPRADEPALVTDAPPGAGHESEDHP
jgi:AhpD family alkylhydroperoxidase